ncbi:TIGR01459 family HAD-type hydrolase [Brevundimonas aveniformis]|uniref:TIGR01459 family HAD-type hydrolase n=1 Tax=Brevundimonas aveniformis TaxID=370977 RepID=UPI0004241077|nr:TIGR01459 family HAD-type hydrolase [Brevundimonas aveniformis]
MSELQTLTGLSEIADRYDVVLCDVWGVVHDGKVPFAASVEALRRFSEQGGVVVLISNSPRPRESFVVQLDDIGVDRKAWAAVVTSGDATRAELAKRAPGPAWRVGPERDAGIYDGTGVELTDDLSEAAFISCTGLFDDDVDQPEDYRDGFSDCARRGLEMVCANPDKVVHRGKDLIWCAGALADVYAAVGGTVVMAGKPFSPIYELALREAGRLRTGALDKSRVLAIGDGLPTDVLGANRQGLDCLFVAGGIHGADVVDAAGRLDPLLAEARLAQSGATARYVLKELTW